MLAAYKSSALVLLATTLITLDVHHEVPYNSLIIALMPQFTFHVPVQAVGDIEYHFVLSFQRGINLLQSCVRCVELQSFILFKTLSLGLLIL